MSQENFDPTDRSQRRSPALMNRNDTAMIVIDVQEKLVPHIAENDVLLFNIDRLAAGAAELGVAMYVTEQYPRGLGKTVADLQAELTGVRVFEKNMFSVRQCTQLIDDLVKRKIKNVLLTGIEAHVCVLQSAMDLITEGFNLYVCIDAIGSRHEEDFMTAMQRMETAGATLVSTEMVLFEWCESAASPEFKKISAIVQREMQSESQ